MYNLQLDYERHPLIRSASIDDLEIIMKLNDELGEYKWTRQHYENALSCQMSIDLFIIAEEVIGVIVYAIAFRELKILSLTIAKNYQRKHIGSTFLFNTLNRSRQIEGVIYATLDVCISNLAAINLYHRFGFRVLCTRKNYYGDISSKDGYLMQLKLSEF